MSRFKEYIKEFAARARRPRMDRGKTTKNDGHIHEYAVDHITGDGATGKDAGHTHKIRKFIVERVDGHIHKLK